MHLEPILFDIDVKLALASSSNPDEVEYYPSFSAPATSWETATPKKDAQFSKPSPEIFEAALEQAGSDPELTLVVGDTPYDILAAHRGALPVAAVQGGVPLRRCRGNCEEDRSNR